MKDQETEMKLGIKILLFIIMALIVNATAKPRLLIRNSTINEPRIEKISSNNGALFDYPPGVIIDSATYYTLIPTFHECMSYDFINDALVAVNRNYIPTGILNVHSAPGDLAYWIDNFGVYGQDYGPARCPSALAGDSGPYISFPYLVSGAWGGAGGQYGSGGWFSYIWDAPVDIGPGDQKAQSCIAKQCINGNIVFLLYSTDPFGIMYRTYDRNLNTLLGQGWLTPTPRYYWGWDYNKTAGIGYLVYIEWLGGYDFNLFYRTTTDGIIWSAEQQYDITWPDPWPGPEILDISWNCQMTVSDAGNPVLVFALSDSADLTYPYTSRVYVCPGPAQPCVQVSSSFGAVDTEAYYCTIATGGNKIGVVYLTPRNNLDDSLCWTDIYYTQSDDLGATWSVPENLTAANTLQRTSIPQVAKRFDVSRNRVYLLYAIAKSPLDDMDLVWAYGAGIPVMSYIICLTASISCTAERDNINMLKPNLAISPNPMTNRALIIYYTYPHPFNNKITLSIYDIIGRLVKRFYQLHSQQNSCLIWNGRDDFDHDVPDGIYFLSLETSEYKQTKKIILIK